MGVCRQGAGGGEVKETKGKAQGIPTIKHRRIHEEDNVHFSS